MRHAWVVPYLATIAGAGCAGPDFPFDDDELDASVLICPRLDLWQLRWSQCPEPGACADNTPGADDDGDGPNEAEGDCDDGDRFVHPGAAEVCDLRDNDCDGEVDEGACGAARVCPLDFADARCCGATHTIAGSFQETGATRAEPMAVVVRRVATGELRSAVTCPGTANGEPGVPYRFHLEDPDFVAPDEDYELIIHLRWYFPAILRMGACVSLRPVVTTDADTAATCIDYGGFTLPCL